MRRFLTCSILLMAASCTPAPALADEFEDNLALNMAWYCVEETLKTREGLPTPDDDRVVSSKECYDNCIRAVKRGIARKLISGIDEATCDQLFIDVSRYE